MTQKAYRIIKKKYSKSAFDGEGSKLYGGRWNSRGRPCVYLAESASLALLEIMVHLDDYQLLSEYVLFEMTLAESDLLSLEKSDLPPDWRDDPAPFSTSQIGDQWLQEQPSLGLLLPSTILPIENNILLNPEHPNARKALETITDVDFIPDPRL